MSLSRLFVVLHERVRGATTRGSQLKRQTRHARNHFGGVSFGSNRAAA